MAAAKRNTNPESIGMGSGPGGMWPGGGGPLALTTLVIVMAKKLKTFFGTIFIGCKSK